MAKIDVGVVTQHNGAHLEEFFASLAETPEVRRVAVADDSGESFALAREVLKDKLAGEYPSQAKLLENMQPKMMLVSMEPMKAPPEIDQALEAGCHVLTEKPACVRVQDFEPLVRKAESKHLEIMLALANRPHAPVQEAKRIIAQGLLGRLYGINMHLVADQARLERDDYQSSWRCTKSRAGGGMLTWLGIHWIDMALFITGLQVEQVSGFTQVVGGQPIDVEDSVAMSLRFQEGLLGTLQSGFYLDKTFKENVQRYHSHMQIWGEHGWLRLSTFEQLPLEWYSTKANGKPRVQVYDYPKGRSYQPFVRQAVRASAGLGEPPITSAEGLHVLKTIYEFYDAAASGETRKVS